MRAASALRPVARVWRGLPNEGGVFCGTAFFVEPTRALTANHVVEHADAQRIYLQVAWGASYVRVKDVKAHGDRAEVDVALLTIDAQSAAGPDALVAIGDPLPIATGMPIDIAGYADENGPAELRRTIVSAIEALATAAIIQPLPARGMSGGPALSPDGSLRGIVWARDVDKGRGYLTPLSVFRDFLVENGVAFAASSPAPRPEYPAANEDIERLKRARKLLLGWRASYAGRLATLDQAARQARAWNRAPPTEPEAAIFDLILLAASTGADLAALPVAELEFAKSYGLGVHPTVFWGQALSDVAHSNDMYGPAQAERIEERKTDRSMPQIASVPNKYGFEMMARVLESAIALARFSPSALPLGFISPPEAMATSNFSGTEQLLLVRTDLGPELRIFALEQVPRQLGSLVARSKPLRVDAARQMADGSLEVLGTDSQFRYRWTGSGQVPSAQFPYEIELFAGFPSADPGSSPVLISEDGSARELYLDGSAGILAPRVGEHCAAAAFWRDPLEPDRGHILRLRKTGILSSTRIGSIPEEATADLRDHLAARPEFDAEMWAPSIWDSDIHLSTLEGFACALVEVRVLTGTTLMFLDPVSLIPVQPARHLDRRLSNVALSLERWLILAEFGVDPGEALMSLWDLIKDADGPAAELRNQWDVQADIYDPFIVPAGASAFHVYFTLRLFNDAHDHWLCRFHWPSQAVEQLIRYADLRTFPVDRDRTV